MPPYGKLKSFIGKPEQEEYVILLKITDSDGVTYFEPIVNVLANKNQGEKELIIKTYELNRAEHIPDFQYDFKQLLGDACKLSKKEENIFSNE